MANFNDQLQRMKSLMTYGAVNEKKEQNCGAMEYHTIGADGKSYGIIRENQKFYIKVAPKNKEMVVESYDYIGGFNNKKDYEYNSYSKALKNFEMKMRSLNEAYNASVNIESLRPFEVNGEVMTEGTKAMMAEIARQRQIMNNVCAIMNENTTISPKNVGVPEAPKTTAFNSKLGEPFTETATAELDKDFKKTANSPEKQGEPFGETEKAENYKDAEYVPQGSVANQKPKGGKVVKVNEIATRDAHEKYFWRIPEDKYYEIVSQYQPEDVEGHLRPETKDALREYLQQNRVDESTKKIWEMMAKLDKSFTLNESCGEWGSCGVNGVGVGSPNGHLMEDEDIAGFADEEFETSSDEMDDIEGDSEMDDFDMDDEDMDGEEFDMDDEDFETDDEDMDDEFDAEDMDDEDMDDEFDAEDMDDEFDAEIDMDMDVDGDGEIGGDSEIDALRAEIESLRAEIESLKGGDNDLDMGDEEFDMDDEDMDGNDFDMDDEDMDGDDFDMGDEDMGDEEFDMGDEDMDGDDFDMDDEDMDDEDFDPETDGEYEDLDESQLAQLDEIDNDANFGISESRKKELLPIVENLVRSIKKENLKEDKLNVFGKHPGYRKKPMTLPATGSDNENGMKDWNDESVRSEQPFGTKIGSSAPYDIVQKVTDSVMEALTGKKKR